MPLEILKTQSTESPLAEAAAVDSLGLDYERHDGLSAFFDRFLGQIGMNSATNQLRGPGYRRLDSGAGISGSPYKIATKTTSRLVGCLCIILILTLSLWFFFHPQHPSSLDPSAYPWDPSTDRLGRLAKGHTEYPTDMTRDILPIPCHSHNDYWRSAPLFEALHYGCIGVEADVWLYDDDLLVGHNRASLTKTRTLRSMYVDPILDLLDRQNPTTKYYDGDKKHGVFDVETAQTLVLVIDFKTAGASTLPVVNAQLEPLRAKGLLSYFDGTRIVPGPVTIVASGNITLDLILDSSSTHRDIFIDAPLDKLDAGHIRHESKVVTSYNASNSYYASVNFETTIGRLHDGRFSDRQLQTIRTQVQSANDKGLKSRYWGAPSWPVRKRNYIWRTLIDQGVHILSVDDLHSASALEW